MAPVVMPTSPKGLARKQSPIVCSRGAWSPCTQNTRAFHAWLTSIAVAASDIMPDSITYLRGMSLSCVRFSTSILKETPLSFGFFTWAIVLPSWTSRGFLQTIDHSITTFDFHQIRVWIRGAHWLLLRSGLWGRDKCWMLVTDGKEHKYCIWESFWGILTSRRTTADPLF